MLLILNIPSWLAIHIKYDVTHTIITCYLFWYPIRLSNRRSNTRPAIIFTQLPTMLINSPEKFTRDMETQILPSPKKPVRHNNKKPRGLHFRIYLWRAQKAEKSGAWIQCGKFTRPMHALSRTFAWVYMPVQNRIKRHSPMRELVQELKLITTGTA